MRVVAGVFVWEEILIAQEGSGDNRDARNLSQTAVEFSGYASPFTVHRSQKNSLFPSNIDPIFLPSRCVSGFYSAKI